MQPVSDQLEDGTLRFLPNRLNRQPVIVLGLTADEMWLSVVLSLVIGLGVGAVFAAAMQSIAIVPSIMFVSVALGLFLGGKALRRLKRGRPQTWLYRQMQWHVRQRVPALVAWIGGSELISRSGYWTARRSGTP